jgi:hypothetical protein
MDSHFASAAKILISRARQTAEKPKKPKSRFTPAWVPGTRFIVRFGINWPKKCKKKAEKAEKADFFKKADSYFKSRIFEILALFLFNLYENIS